MCSLRSTSVLKGLIRAHTTKWLSMYNMVSETSRISKLYGDWFLQFLNFMTIMIKANLQEGTTNRSSRFCMFVCFCFLFVCLFVLFCFCLFVCLFFCWRTIVKPARL